MNISTAVFFIVAILIVGFASILVTRKRRRHHKHHEHHSGTLQHTKHKIIRNGRGLLKKADHGAMAAIEHGIKRSPLWAHVEKQHLLREPGCVVCGYKGKWVQVHHVKPFHLHPELELDPHNLVTLCERKGRDHHLLLGHFDNWKSYNEHIRADAKHYYNKTAAQIRADLIWQKKMSLRP